MTWPKIVHIKYIPYLKLIFLLQRCKMNMVMSMAVYYLCLKSVKSFCLKEKSFRFKEKCFLHCKYQSYLHKTNTIVFSINSEPCSRSYDWADGCIQCSFHTMSGVQNAKWTWKMINWKHVSNEQTSFIFLRNPMHVFYSMAAVTKGIICRWDLRAANIIEHGNV